MTRQLQQIVTTPRLLTVCAAALVALALTATLHASIPITNTMTVHKAVALPGVVLAPGDYVFQVLDTASGHVVRVSSRNGESRYLGLTMPADRTGRAGASIVLGEAPAGQPQPILSWFPDGLNHGEQFLYR
jgi:hypothetical protein